MSNASPGGANRRYTIALRNLILLIGVVAATSLWALHWTALFPLIGGVLSVTGALTWLAALQQWLPTEFQQTVQERLFERFFARRQSLFVIIGGGLVTLFVALSVGTVEVRSAGEESGRSVSVYLDRFDRDDSQQLSPGGSIRYARWLGPLQSTVWRLKVSGLPARTVKLGWLGWQPVDVPDGLYRRTILIRSSIALMADLEFRAKRKKSMTLKVTFDGATEPLEMKNYLGQTIWVGCDDDVQIPAEILAEVRDELKKAKNSVRADRVARILYPDSIHGATVPVALPEARTFSVNLHAPNGKPYYEPSLTYGVEPLAPKRAFAQIVVLEKK